MGFGLGLREYVPFLSYLGLMVLVFGAVYRVQYGIYFLVPFFPFRTIYNAIEAYPLGRTVIDLIFVGMIVSWLAKRDREVDYSFSYIPIAALVITTFLGVLNGMNNVDVGASFLKDTRLRDWKNYAMMPLIYVIVMNNMRNKDEIRKSCVAMFIAVALQGILFYKNFADRSVEHFTYEGREGGTFAFLGPNHLASFFVEYCMIAIALFFGMKKEEGKWLKILCGGVVVSSVYATVWLFSRGAYAGLLAGVCAYALLRKRILVPFIVILVLFWQSILPVPVVERINSTLQEGMEEHETMGHRKKVWERSIEVYKQHPVFGIGYRTFQYTKQRGDTLGDSHNMFLSVMAEMGTIGLVVFVLILLTAMSRGIILYRAAADPFLRHLGLGFFLSTITIAVMNLFGDRWSYIMMQAFYWTFWGLVDKGIVLARKRTV